MRLPKLKDSFQQCLLLVVLVVLLACLSAASEHFMTWRNWRNILDHMSTQTLLALGMTFVVATGGIDLSVGGIIALSGVAMAMLMRMGVPPWAAILAGLAFSLLLGRLNGALVTGAAVSPFILTLGTASLYRGAAIILTGGTPIYNMPVEFTRWGKGMGAAVNPPILISVVAVVVAAVLLNFTKWGLYAQVEGGNETALRRLGVDVKRHKTSVYMLSAFLAGVSALIITARLNTAEPTAGVMMELDAVTAVVMGGTLMQGGKAGVGGTVVACVLLAVIRNGLTLLSINSFYQQFIIGALLLVSVIATEARRNLIYGTQGGERINE